MTDISSEYAKLLTRGAINQGHSLNSLLNRAGIPTTAITTPNTRLTFQQISALYKIIWIETGDENLGLGQLPCKLGNFRLLADILSRYERLDVVLQYAEKFYDVTRNDIVFRVKHEGALARVTIEVDSGADPDHLLQEYYLMAWQRYICWLLGIQIDWLETTFSFPRPERADVYNSLFSGELLFSQQNCSFAFNSRYLKRRVNRSRVDVSRYIQALPRPLFTPIGTSTTYSLLVKEKFERGDCSALPNFQEVATSLSINPRTLHRKLVDEGTSFQAIKSQYRCDVAIECLLEKRMSIQAVSFYVGFGEPSSFCRFFKGATGLSPTKYTEVFAGM